MQSYNLGLFFSHSTAIFAFESGWFLDAFQKSGGKSMEILGSFFKLVALGLKWWADQPIIFSYFLCQLLIQLFGSRCRLIF